MKISYRVGTTINIGDFSNIKYELEVTDDRRDGETKEQATARVAKFVEDELDKKIEDTREDLAASIKEVTDAAKRLKGQ